MTKVYGLSYGLFPTRVSVLQWALAVSIIQNALVVSAASNTFLSLQNKAKVLISLSQFYKKQVSVLQKIVLRIPFI
jgi:hypothetical protein